MRIDQLEQLVKLFDYRSISAACNEIHITPQSLSRSITSIENELGVTLIERNSKGIHFTPEGIKVKEMAERVLEDYAKTLQDISGKKPPKSLLSGNLILYTSSPISNSILNSFTNSYCQLNPKVSITVKDLNGNPLQEIQNDMPKNCLILLLTPFSDELNGSFWQYAKELEEIAIPNSTGEFYFCCSKESSLARQKEISFKKIINHPLVCFTYNNNNTAGSIQAAFFHDATPKVSLYTTSLIAWINAVKYNLGVGIFFESYLWDSSLSKNMFADLAVLSISEKPMARIAFLCQPHASPLVQSFVEHFKKSFL